MSGMTLHFARVKFSLRMMALTCCREGFLVMPLSFESRSVFQIVFLKSGMASPKYANNLKIRQKTNKSHQFVLR